MRREGEDGYALVAAILSIALFASLALTMINATRGTLVTASAELDRARLLAAADAGVALTLQELMQPNAIAAVPIDGSIRRRSYDGNRLAIAVQDERGKIALNAINKQQADAMFGAFGVRGNAREVATDSFLDWRDVDGDTRLLGSEAGDYASLGRRPRDGPLKTVGELALIHGIGPALAARITPFATLDYGPKGEFDPRFASTVARQVMADPDDRIEFATLEDAQQTGQAIRAVSLVDRNSLIGRPLTIIVDASDGRGGHARRQLLVELAGENGRNYAVRARE